MGWNSDGNTKPPVEEQKAANDALVAALETHPTIEAVVLTGSPNGDGGFYKSKSDAEVVAAVRAHAQQRRLATCLLIVDVCGRRCVE